LSIDELTKLLREAKQRAKEERQRAERGLWLSVRTPPEVSASAVV
jgi:hypothetical protein